MALKAGAILIKAGRTKHGPGRHRWGQKEYVQAAAGVLYPNGILSNVSDERGFKAKLVRQIRVQLNRDPAYRARGFRRIGRNTILRALGL